MSENTPTAAHEFTHSDLKPSILDNLALSRAELLVLTDEASAMTTAGQRIREVGDFDMSLIGRVEVDGVMVHRSWQGTKSNALHRLVVPEGIGLGGKSIMLQQPVWVRDYLSDPGITHDFDALVAQESLRGMLAVPMAYEGHVLGAMYVGTREYSSFGDRVIAEIQSIAETAAVTLLSAQRTATQTELALEAERKRLAESLHDSVSPVLFRIGAELQSLRALADAQAIHDRLQDITEQVHAVNASIRRSLTDLTARPPERNLPVGIEEDCQAFTLRTGIPARFVPLTESPELDASRVEALQRLVREALVNVEKHADASTVVVSLSTRSGRVTVVVSDDGRGVDGSDDPTRGSQLGLGLAAGRLERLGGGMSVASDDESGTTVRGWVDALEGPST
ncbi:GAF domain-containing sensor histidine kinase [Rhodococcus pyridinivorans]|uniref:GAF domain-containing sensor histidine kinase n=1 Tax=Rhodococcus pyridinivorans TaxID=103816 RepID=UPI00177B4252|nr:GAF domain-containing protein [Rhodococcus pyridinivorans]QOH59529.1 histidine kinase [Rhodococcus rhodochrous]WAL49447.1 GAF domain-containing protein [Rhodococcus pyridinivorans]